MKPLASALSTLVTRVTVVHSLPGRLRLHVPAIAHIPPAWSIADLQTIAVRGLTGVRRVEASRQTATLLVEYDASLREDEIIRFVRDTLRLIVELSPRFTALAPEAQQRAMNRILALLDSEKVHAGAEIKVPDWVWANGGENDR